MNQQIKDINMEKNKTPPLWFKLIKLIICGTLPLVWLSKFNDGTIWSFIVSFCIGGIIAFAYFNKIGESLK